MTTKLTTNNLSSSLLTLVSQPTISSIVVTDSSYVATGVTAVDLSGGYIKITGTGFASGSTVYVDSTPVTSVTFVNSTQLNCVVPALTSNSYVVYVVNLDGSVAIRVNGITYSSTPNWVTSSVQSSNPIVNIQLVATSDTTISYALAAGSSLPSGLTLSSGGLLSGTVTGSTNITYNFSVIATDLESQNSTRAFSVSITFGDTYFNYTTLLLNGETSVTPFTNDASTNGFVLTIQGDIKPVSFNPYQGDGYYSNYLDGASYILGTTGTGVTIGTSDFCLEAWAYWTSFNYGTYGAPAISLTGATAGELMIRATKTSASSTTANFFNIVGASTYIPSSMFSSGVSAGTLYLNRWHHVAVQRVSGTWYFYVDGSMVSSTSTGDASLTLAFTKFYIGYDGGGAGYGYMAGYVSNTRLIVGTTPYATAGFTVPTSPLTSNASTKFLSAQSNKFVDNSTSSAVFTMSGAVSVSSAIPFTANSIYSTYGSTYFDGTGDYLTAPNNTAFSLSGGNYTIEFWAYWSSISGEQVLVERFSAPSGPGYTLYKSSAHNIQLYGSGVVVTSTTAVAAGIWYHIAITYNGTNSRMFINGVQEAISASNITDGGTTLIVGSRTGASVYFNGYISDFRVVKGTAVYTTAFTPPTSPLTAITNTSLLTLQYNGGTNNNSIMDNSNFNNIITRNGNSSQGSFSPYSVTGWSNYFNGSSDYLQTSASIFGLGTIFTVEAWIYPTISPTNAIVFASTASGEFSLGYNGSTRFGVSARGVSWLIDSTSLPVVNTWNHIVVVRGGLSTNQTSLYINGTRVINSTISSAFTTLSTWNVGYDGGGGGSVWTGYISNLRVVAGTDVYGYTNTTITSPTNPLTATINTKLLTCQSNRFIDNSPNNYAVTTAGTPSIQAFSPFGSISEATPISYSNFYGTTTMGWQTPASSATNIIGTATLNSTSTFTVEAWIYPLARHSGGGAVLGYVFGSMNLTGGQSDWSIGPDSNGKLTVFWYNSGNFLCNSTNVIPLNTWTHIAVSISAGAISMYINGVKETLTGTTTATTTSGAPLGYLSSGGYTYSGTTWQGFNGFISNLRVVKSALYSSTSFTPSTTPLTAIANTSLLTCQSTRIIDNSTNAYALTVTNSLLVSKYNPFGYTAQIQTNYTPSTNGGSIYLDGTGDYLTTPNNAFDLTTTIWCIEYWIYPTTISSGYYGLWALSTSGFRQGIYTDSVTHYLAVLNGGGGYGGFTLVAANKVITLNNWQHIALTSDGTTIRQFYNGVQTSTGTAASFSASSPTIGSWGGSYLFVGYMSDFRITKGSAVYTSNFAPPTQTLTTTVTSGSSTYNAVVLLNNTNGGIIDQHSSLVMETVGNTQLSTSVKKYGNSSIYFDGTGDYLTMPSSPLLDFGTGDFTFECWVYTTVTTSGTVCYINGNTGTYAALRVGVQSNQVYLLMSTNGSTWAVQSGLVGTATANEWNHIAVTRASSTVRIFINGVVLGTTYSIASALMTGTVNSIGAYAFNPFEYLTGYIDDLRLTKGYARYTGTFVPPAALVTK